MYSFTSLNLLEYHQAELRQVFLLYAKDLDDSGVDYESLNGSVTPINANVPNRQPGY